VPTNFTLEGNPKDFVGLPPKLTQQQADDLQKGTGNTTVFFMSVFTYTDDSGEHELEHCVFTQGKGVGRCTSGHNGPTNPKM
jgi:hypothetical protein